MELDQRIKQEIEENPALEEGAESLDDDFDIQDDYDDDGNDKDDFDFDISDYMDDDTPDYKTQVNNHSKDEDDRVIPLSGEQSFQERLTEQLHLLDLDDTQFLIADTIIGNLDESGYLNREVEAIVDDLAFSANVLVSEEQVEEVLSLVQELDPAGVGARDLRECLLLQINRRQDGDITRFTAKKILEDRSIPQIEITKVDPIEFINLVINSGVEAGIVIQIQKINEHYLLHINNLKQGDPNQIGFKAIIGVPNSQDGKIKIRIQKK
jgi:RNA polymerase sigma-54 factor